MSSKKMMRPIAVAIFCLWSHAILAADISVNTKSVQGLAPKSTIRAHSLRLNGEFVSGDSDRLRAVLARLKTVGTGFAGGPLATIELNSPGGLLAEGLRIGYLLKEYEVATVVRKGDVCLSACALAFLGGTTGHTTPGTSTSRSLEIGGDLGFHGFYLDPKHAPSDAPAGLLQGLDEGKLLSSVIVAYGVDMRIDPGLVAEILPSRQNEFKFIETVADFLALRIIPLGLSPPASDTAKQATNICNHSTGWVRPTQEVGKPLTLPQARRHILGHVAGSMEQALKKGPLSSQVIAIAKSGDDHAIEQLYGDLSAAGLPLPGLWGSTYLVGGFVFGAGFYTMECVVSVSNDSYDLVLLETVGLSAAKRFVNSDSARLFFYGQKDVINRRQSNR